MPASAEHPSTSTHRFPELDSLRGLAAAIVVLHHILGLCSWPVQSWANLLPTSLLFAGDSAVLLFFTLSGFVLTLPFRRSAPPTYAAYLLKRICRIYLPYAAALLLAVAVCALVPAPVLTGHPWIDATWNSPITLRDILLHLTGIGHFNTRLVYGPFWTLVIEMRVSLAMPLLSRLALRLKLLPGLAASLSACLALHLLDSRLHHHDLIPTLYYACLFLNGALLAAHFSSLTAAWHRLSSTTRNAAGLLALLTFAYAESLSTETLAGNTLLQHSAGLRQCLVSLASMLFIVLATQSPRIRRLLHHPAILRSGAISYSLYLTHLIVLLTWVHLFWGGHSLLWFLPIYLAASWLLAELFHRLIEQPSARLGRWFDQHLRTLPVRERALGADGQIHTSPARTEPRRTLFVRWGR